MKKEQLGLFLGILVAIIILIIPINGLSTKGKSCLALTMMTVIFWGFQIVHPAYISGLYLSLIIIFKISEPSVVFSSWTGSTMYLTIGAYLIASAVKESGLGERIAYYFIIRYVKSYNSIIISVFVLNLLLSAIIPHPWPRAFLIMSVISVIITNAKINKQDATNIGFAVFAASVPTSLVFLTGESVINTLAIQYSGVNVGWFQWLIYMGPPALALSVFTCIIILVLFKSSQPIILDKQEMKNQLSTMGGLTKKEKFTIGWLFVSIILWMTDSIHGINIGWITFLIAMLISLPIVGNLLTRKSWMSVPIDVLLFITAAIAIGKVGADTGMNQWIAQVVLPEPSVLSGNIYILASIITVVSIALHMILGSVIAVMGVVIPALLTYTNSLGLNPLVITLWAYTAISTHYILPFHHLNLLVGMGEENGNYTQKETIRLGIPLTITVYLTIIFIQIPWWKFLKLL